MIRYLRLVVFVNTGVANDVFIFCMELPKPRTTVVKQKEMFPSVLVFVGMTFDSSLIMKDVKLQFSIIPNREIVNLTCVRIQGLNFDQTSCTTNAGLSPEIIICLCKFVNAIYTVKGVSYISMMKS